MKRFSPPRSGLPPDGETDAASGEPSQETLRDRRESRTVSLFLVYVCLCFAAALIAWSGRIAVPNFGIVPLFLFYIAIAAGVYLFTKQGCLAGCASVCLFVVVTAVYGTAQILNPPTQREESTSPNGVHTLVVQRDFVDRPSVYLKEKNMLTPLLSASDMPFYNETFASWIHWVDDNCFVLITGTGEAWIYSIDTLEKREASWVWEEARENRGYTVLADGEVFCKIPRP